MKSPKVSVIIPVYNTEKYVEKAVKSIMDQTLKNIEIIIINDGSTDNSLSVIQKLAYEDDRMEYLYAVANQLTEGQRRELRERAKKDGKTSFWYALP